MASGACPVAVQRNGPPPICLSSVFQPEGSVVSCGGLSAHRECLSRGLAQGAHPGRGCGDRACPPRTPSVKPNTLFC